MGIDKVQIEPVAFRRGNQQLIGVRTPKGIWVGEQCYKVGKKWEIVPLPAESSSAKKAIAKYNDYLEYKARKIKAEEEAVRWRKEAAEEQRNLIANLEPGMYLAVRHCPGLGVGHVYVVGRVDRIEYKKRKKPAGEERVVYVQKYFRKSGVWDKSRPLSDFGWLLTEKQAQAVMSGKMPLYNRSSGQITHPPLEPL